jgi:hypothetical protein
MNETLLKAGFILGASVVVFLLNGKSSAIYKNISNIIAEKKKQRTREKLEPEKINFC